MIQAKDLRIGNLVQVGNNVITVESIIEYGVNVHAGDMSSIGVDYEFKAYYNPIEGIPLTEEWLIKFGFQKNKQDGRYGYKYNYGQLDSNYIVERDWQEYPSHFFGIEYTDSPFPEDEGKTYNFAYEITYVHQLQNLIFSLTGEELTLTETVIP